METINNIKTSANINELVSALAKVQGSMKPAVFNRINPHFKTRYADFTSCMEACIGLLSQNGIALIQACQTIDGKLTLVTLLAHTSGQWMTSEFPLIATKMDSQGIGSAMTYAKRYSLCGMVGIVADEEGDDDGEAAVGRHQQSQKINPQQVNMLKQLESKLDAECKIKIKSWLNVAYKTDIIENFTVDNFQKILSAYENAVKFLEQKKLEEQTVNV